jgi:hypothetical protein
LNFLAVVFVPNFLDQSFSVLVGFSNPQTRRKKCQPTLAGGKSPLQVTDNVTVEDSPTKQFASLRCASTILISMDVGITDHRLR